MSSDELLAALRAPHTTTDAVHLNAAGVAPMSRLALRAGTSAMERMCEGTRGASSLITDYERARTTFAQLVGAAREDLAFVQTCAAAISQVALGMDLRAGDEIVLLDQEYPSNAYPWYRAAERAGARVVVVPSRADLSIDVGAISGALTSRTRVVAVSWVQFSSGACVDLARLAEAAHGVGAWLVTDAIQGIGVIPFDLRALGVDFVCGGSHKWLLGPVGLGFLAARPGLMQALTPLLYGAITYGTPDDAVDPHRQPRAEARRFEPGSPPVANAIAAAASVEALLGIGVARVMSEALALKLLLENGLVKRGYATRASGGGGLASPITTFIPRTDPKALVTALAARGVSVAARGGGVRVAPHVICQAAHIERFFAHLDELDRA